MTTTQSDEAVFLEFDLDQKPPCQLHEDREAVAITYHNGGRGHGRYICQPCVEQKKTLINKPNVYKVECVICHWFGQASEIHFDPI